MLHLAEFYMQLVRNRRSLRIFAIDDRGATSIEYALIAVIVSVSIIAGAVGIRNSLTSTFNAVASSFSQ
jgi:pilus assembly protein Flp/PilA